jgi:hypothetical protein
MGEQLEAQPAEPRMVGFAAPEVAASVAQRAVLAALAIAVGLDGSVAIAAPSGEEPPASARPRRGEPSLFEHTVGDLRAAAMAAGWRNWLATFDATAAHHRRRLVEHRRTGGRPKDAALLQRVGIRDDELVAGQLRIAGPLEAGPPGARFVTALRRADTGAVHAAGIPEQQYELLLAVGGAQRDGTALLIKVEAELAIRRGQLPDASDGDPAEARERERQAILATAGQSDALRQATTGLRRTLRGWGLPTLRFDPRRGGFPLDGWPRVVDQAGA